MAPEDRLLLACARQSFLPEHQETVVRLSKTPGLRWDRIHELAELHGIAPLVWVGLRRCGEALDLPAEIAGRFRSSRSWNVVRKQKAAHQILRALSCFQVYSLDVMLIKGAALDLVVYERPWYMVASDVDMVLRCKGEGEIFDRTRGAVISLYRSGVECDYFQHHDVTMSGTLPVDFEQIWQAARPVEVEGMVAFLMSPEDMLLAACINSCRRRFLHLRSTCDVAECVERLAGLDWELLGQRAREFGCESIAYTALLVAESLLGCRIPPGALECLGVHPARRWLLTALLRSPLQALLCSRSRGRGLDPSLLLPYASYRWPQLRSSLAVRWSRTAGREQRRISSMASAARDPLLKRR